MSKKNQTAKAPFIGSREEAPEWLQEIEIDGFLETGFRINFSSYSLASLTLFMWHNETINIWTHLIASASALFVVAILTTRDFYTD